MKMATDYYHGAEGKCRLNQREINCTMSCKEYRIKKARYKEKLNTYMIRLRSMTAKL